MLTRLPDGRWRVDLRPDGGYGRRVRKIFLSKAEALRFEAHAKHQAIHGKPWNPTPTDQRTFKALIDLWHELHGKTLKDGDGRNRMLLAMDAAMGHPKAAALDAQLFTTYRAARLAGEHNVREGRTPNANTVNHELAYARAVFNELKRAGEWKSDNPLSQVRAFKLDDNEMAWLTRPQIIALLDACALSDNVALLPVVHVCLSTGARWGEALGLTRSQVHDGKITFSKTKSGRARTVPYEDVVIDEWIDGRKGHLFQECTGAFRSAIARAGIELPKGQLTHVLRHTFGAHYMQNGGDILTLQRILGHKSITMTMRYAHFSPGHLADAPKRSPLANLFGQFLDTTGRA